MSSLIKAAKECNWYTASATSLRAGFHAILVVLVGTNMCAANVMIGQSMCCAICYRLHHITLAVHVPTMVLSWIIIGKHVQERCIIQMQESIYPRTAQVHANITILARQQLAASRDAQALGVAISSAMFLQCYLQAQ